jgi:hypothetical protein
LLFYHKKPNHETPAMMNKCLQNLIVFFIIFSSIEAMASESDGKENGT